MICCVLAGGFATRLYPLTFDKPKALLEVRGQPLLEHLLNDIHTIPDITRILIVTNEKFFRTTNDWILMHHYSLPIEVINNGISRPEDSLGAVDSIVQVIRTCRLREDLMVLAADNLLDFSLKYFAEYQKMVGGSCVMWYFEEQLDNLRKTGVGHIENGKLVRMVEKPIAPLDKCAIPPFYIYSTDLFGSIVQSLEQGCRGDSPGHLLEWLVRKHEINAMKMPGLRYDIGDLHSYKMVKSMFDRKTC